MRWPCKIAGISARLLASGRTVVRADFGAKWCEVALGPPQRHRVVRWCLRRAAGMGLACVPCVPLLAALAYFVGSRNLPPSLLRRVPVIWTGWAMEVFLAIGAGAWLAGAVAVLLSMRCGVLKRSWLWALGLMLCAACLLIALLAAAHLQKA